MPRPPKAATAPSTAAASTAPIRYVCQNSFFRSLFSMLRPLFCRRPYAHRAGCPPKFCRTMPHRINPRLPLPFAFRKRAVSVPPGLSFACAWVRQADTSCHIHETRPSPFGPAPLSVWHLFHPPYPSLAFGFVKWTYYTIERHGAATDTPVAKNGRRTKPRVKRAALRAPQSTCPCGRRSLNGGPPRAFLIRTQGFPAKTAPPGAAAACTPRLGHVLCKAASPLKTVLPARLSPERGRFAFAVRNV